VRAHAAVRDEPHNGYKYIQRVGSAIGLQRQSDGGEVARMESFPFIAAIVASEELRPSRADDGAVAIE